MSTAEALSGYDPELIAFLEEQGIDFAVFLARQKELQAYRRSPEEQAKIDAAHKELAPLMEALAVGYAQHGLWHELDEE